MCGDDTHTCLIYLTDDFIGGFLTVEEGEEEEEDNNVNIDMMNVAAVASNLPLTITTFVPRTGYCVIYPKGVNNNLSYISMYLFKSEHINTYIKTVHSVMPLI